MKGMNIMQLNTLHLNVVLLNGDEMPGEVVVGGGEVVPVPPTEPETPDVPDVPVEPKKFILSASVTNGVVSASVNGVAVSLPYNGNEGEVVVLSVVPNEGYEFLSWADGVTDNPRTIVMSADVALSAECAEVVAPPVEPEEPEEPVEPPVESKHIQFADAEVERVLMANGVSSDGVGITIEDAEKVTSIDTWFKGNTAITSFEELQYFTGVTTLYGAYQGGAFYNCTNLQRITLPSSLVKIGSYNFQNCSSLNSVGGFESIIQFTGEGGFAGCPLAEIETINLPNLEGVLCKRVFNKMTHPHRIENLGKITAISNTSYSDGVFGNGATYLRLPSTIESIGAYAFQNLTKLEQIVCDALVPPTISKSFDGSTCPIYVPDASLEAYKTALNWSAYADRIRPLSEIEGG